MHYDVFNGDADGIIALLQLRLITPRESKLITGVKRDISLLKQLVFKPEFVKEPLEKEHLVKKDPTSVTVLDVSMDKNKAELEALLDKKIPVFYCDHHRTGDIPESEYLTTQINLDSEICTSLLIHQLLEENNQATLETTYWAIAGAFGDNLNNPATALAQKLELSEQAMAYLKELGTLINYNGYGADLDDLHIPPAELFERLLSFTNPFELLDVSDSAFYQLKAGYEQDNANVEALKPMFSNEICEVYELPCEAWARRISGVFGNELANKNPEKAHAVLTLNNSQDDYTVSVRAPLSDQIEKSREGADDVCCQFDTGGGRKAAAGINQLPKDQVQRFIETLNNQYN